jgi:hypothetical protein
MELPLPAAAIVAVRMHPPMTSSIQSMAPVALGGENR